MSWESELMDLREGREPFARFARRHAGRFARWARAVLGGRARALGHVVSEEDLAQEMLLACWRAVDAWDPTRCSRAGVPVPLARFVDYQVGRAGQREAERALVWLRRGAPGAPFPVHVEDIAALAERRQPDAPAALPADLAAHAAMTAEALGGLVGDVVAGVAAGLSLDQVAARLYADRPRARRYRMDSADHARERVAAACGVATEILSGA